MRPWEAVGSSVRAWEHGGVVNRVISISRENVTSTAGVQPVQEFNGTQRSTIATGILCGIEINRERGIPLAEEPGDVQARTTWKILIEPGDAVSPINAAGAIQTRDIVTDDVGLSYQVSQAWWDVMSGWQLRAELLQA